MISTTTHHQDGRSAGVFIHVYDGHTEWVIVSLLVTAQTEQSKHHQLKVVVRRFSNRVSQGNGRLQCMDPDANVWYWYTIQNGQCGFMVLETRRVAICGEETKRQLAGVSEGATFESCQEVLSSSLFHTCLCEGEKYTLNKHLKTLF